MPHGVAAILLLLTVWILWKLVKIKEVNKILRVHAGEMQVLSETLTLRNEGWKELKNEFDYIKI